MLLGECYANERKCIVVAMHIDVIRRFPKKSRESPEWIPAGVTAIDSILTRPCSAKIPLLDTSGTRFSKNLLDAASPDGRRARYCRNMQDVWLTPGVGGSRKLLELVKTSFKELVRT